MKNSVDVQLISKHLPLLTSLSITYGSKNIGTDELFPKNKRGGGVNKKFILNKFLSF